MLLGDQDAVRVVVAVTLAVTVWTVLLLAFAYPVLRRVCLGFARTILASKVRLSTFVGLLLAVPLTLIAA